VKNNLTTKSKLAILSLFMLIDEDLYDCLSRNASVSQAHEYIIKKLLNNSLDIANYNDEQLEQGLKNYSIEYLGFNILEENNTSAIVKTEKG
jgi:hypothetical protein